MEWEWDVPMDGDMGGAGVATGMVTMAGDMAVGVVLDLLAPEVSMDHVEMVALVIMTMEILEDTIMGIMEAEITEITGVEIMEIMGVEIMEIMGVEITVVAIMGVGIMEAEIMVVVIMGVAIMEAEIMVVVILGVVMEEVVGMVGDAVEVVEIKCMYMFLCIKVYHWY